MPSREEFDNVKLAEGAWRSVGQFWMKVSLRLVHIRVHCSCTQRSPCPGRACCDVAHTARPGSTATKARQIPCRSPTAPQEDSHHGCLQHALLALLQLLHLLQVV